MREIIATRTFARVDGEGVIRAEMSAPVEQIRNEWLCVIFLFPEEHGAVEGRGVDGFQAIQSAMRGLRVKLDQLGIPLVCHGQSYQESLPRPAPSGYGLAFLLQIEKRMDTSVRYYVRMNRALKRVRQMVLGV